MNDMRGYVMKSGFWKCPTHKTQTAGLFWPKPRPSTRPGPTSPTLAAAVSAPPQRGAAFHDAACLARLGVYRPWRSQPALAATPPQRSSVAGAPGWRLPPPAALPASSSP